MGKNIFFVVAISVISFLCLANQTEYGEEVSDKASNKDALRRLNSAKEKVESQVLPIIEEMVVYAKDCQEDLRTYGASEKNKGDCQRYIATRNLAEKICEELKLIMDKIEELDINVIPLYQIKLYENICVDSINDNKVIQATFVALKKAKAEGLIQWSIAKQYDYDNDEKVKELKEKIQKGLEDVELIIWHDYRFYSRNCLKAQKNGDASERNKGDCQLFKDTHEEVLSKCAILRSQVRRAQEMYPKILEYSSEFQIFLSTIKIVCDDMINDDKDIQAAIRSLQ